MKHLRPILVLLFLLLASDPAWAGDFLNAAHEAYLEGRFNDMTSAMRQALMRNPEDQTLRKNIAQLLDAAYAQGAQNQIDPGWTLPAEVSPLAFTLKRIAWKNGESWQYMLWLGGLSDKPGLIEQIRLVRYPDKVIFDKAAKVGAWSEAKSPAAGKTFYGMSRFIGQTAPQDGLYEFELLLTGDKTVHRGWFLSFNLAAKESPELVLPHANENLLTQNPLFRWNPFVSSMKRPYEDRMTQLSIATNGENCEKTYVWEAYGGPDLISLTISDLPKVKNVDLDSNPQSDAAIDVGRLAGILYHTGPDTLPDGSYVVDLKYMERKTFGPMQLKRYAVTSIPFSIGPAEIREIECNGQ